MTHRMHLLLGVLSALVITALSITKVAADSRVVPVEVSPGVVATAEYWPGQQDLPPLIILHGFLQTREFHTVRRLAEALADAGYPVLTPTLALNIDRRQESLACEAIHTHSMDSDRAEIRRWVRWLDAETRRAPIIIGHSTGSLQSISYLAQGNSRKVAQAILISLTHFQQGVAPEDIRNNEHRAAGGVGLNKDHLTEFQLSFCRRYITTPAHFLSYFNWSEDKTITAIKNLNTPTTVIVGGQDRRLDSQWVDLLRHHGLQVVAIEGANHFFDAQYEFELVDAVLAVLASATPGETG